MKVTAKVNKKQLNATWRALVVLVAIGVGALSVLAWQGKVSEIEAEGVAEYKITHCDKFADEKKQIVWLECDE